MSIWKLITKNYTLEDDRDVMARIGLRFVLCTGPYFLLATIAASLGSSVFFALWPALFVLAIPFAGGIVDWYRINKRVERAERVENGAA